MLGTGSYELSGYITFVERQLNNIFLDTIFLLPKCKKKNSKSFKVEKIASWVFVLHVENWVQSMTHYKVHPGVVSENRARSNYEHYQVWS